MRVGGHRNTIEPTKTPMVIVQYAAKYSLPTQRWQVFTAQAFRSDDLDLFSLIQ